MSTITMSEEMLHEVLCTYLHDKVENAWDEAATLVEEIKKGAIEEAIEDSPEDEATVHDTREDGIIEDEWMEDQELGI